MRLACIDIGSNTTRLLVAEFDGRRLQPVEERRAFTALAATQLPDGTIPSAKVEEVVATVGAQLRCAAAHGVGDVRIVATAAVREALNAEALVARLREALGVELRVLEPEEEARLAFRGAAEMLERFPDGPLAVIDLGGGSCELATGTRPDCVDWFVSLALGSGLLARQFLTSDPPRAEDLERVRIVVCGRLEGLEVPPAAEVVAVGGSATSLRRLAGDCLDHAALTRALEELRMRSASDVASRFGLEIQRVRLLPAALVILAELARRFGRPLHVGRGGVREGILIEAAA